MKSEKNPAKLIRSRTAAREAVLSVLYEIEVGHTAPKKALEDILSRETYASEAEAFIRLLINGVEKHLEMLDQKIAQFLAPGWTYDRLSVIDRNALRIASFELFFLEKIPPKSSINEAVTLSKKFGSVENSRFVNGVLGRLLEASPKARWNPALAEEEEQVQEKITGEPEETLTIQEGSEEHQEFQKIEKWALKSDPKDHESAL